MVDAGSALPDVLTSSYKTSLAWTYACSRFSTRNATAAGALRRALAFSAFKAAALSRPIEDGGGGASGRGWGASGSGVFLTSHGRTRTRGRSGSKSGVQEKFCGPDVWIGHPLGLLAAPGHSFSLAVWSCHLNKGKLGIWKFDVLSLLQNR